MSEATRHRLDCLPLTQVRQLDDACARFEAAWQAADVTLDRPRIETFLGAVPETARPALVNELVGLEIELRRKAGENPQREEYRTRFPSLDKANETTQVLNGAGSAVKAETQIHIPGYEIIQELGRGGMGVVYWAWQEKLHRPVALKMILAGLHAGQEELRRFRTEAEAVARLHHPNIVQVYEVGWHEPSPYIAFEYVDGGNLGQRLGATPQPARAAAQMVECMAKAVHYAHERGIIHRDLGPGNVLVTADGIPKITDFGLAKVFVGGGETLTHTGQILGTPSFMAPEQAAGQTGLISPATDVYALGAILYLMLTGRPPLKGETPLETLRQVLSTEPVSPKRLQPSLPRDLDTIAMMCLRKEPGKRYGTAQALADDLRRFLAGMPVHARPLGRTERLWRWCRRNPTVAALTTAVLVLLVTLSVGSLLKNAELSRALADSEQARRQTQAQLWESLRDRARLSRMARAPGQRLEGLLAIRQALQLPVPAGHSLQELQTEAIAALALPDLEVLRAWEGLPNGHVGMDFDGMLERYARLGTDGTVSVLLACEDKEIARWREPNDGPWPSSESNLLFSPDGCFLCIRQPVSGHLTIRRLDAAGAIISHEMSQVRDAWAMDFSPDSKRLACLLTDNRIAIVDLVSGQTAYLPSSGADGEDCIRFAPDGRRLALVVRRGARWAVEVRDTATGQVRQTMAHPGVTSHVAWHPDGRTLATGCEDGIIRLWDVASSKVRRHLTGKSGGGVRCAFISGGDRLVSNNWASVLRVWEPSSGAQLLSFPSGGYGFLRASADNRLVAADVADPTKLQLLRLHPGLEYRTITFGLGGAGPGIRGDHLLKVHPDGRLLAASNNENGLVFVDLVGGREVGNLQRRFDMPLSWESSGNLLICGQSGMSRWPLRADPGELGRYLCGPPEQLLGFTSFAEWGISADAKTVAIPAFDNGALLVHMGQPVRKYELSPQRDVRNCALSPDGRWVATASHGGSDSFGVKVWDAATGKLTMGLPVPALCRVAFSPDGRWLLTTGGGCRLWDVETWELARKIGGTSGCFSPDGRFLAVDDSAGAILLIRPESGALVARLEAPERTRLLPRGFTPEGSRLIAVGVDTQALHVWDLGAIQRGLLDLGLAAGLPPYPPANDPNAVQPIWIDVKVMK